MRWSTFGIFLYLALVLDTGLRTLWALPVGGGVAPSLVLILVVHVALSARPMQAAWAAVIAGVLMDLSSIGEQGTDLLLVGPTAMGLLLGVAVTIRFRQVLYRQSPVALAVSTLGVGLIAHTVVIILISLRGAFTLGPVMGGSLAEPVPEWHFGEQLFRRFVESLYTAVLALPVGFLLIRTDRWWAFAPGKHGSGGMGGRR